MPDEVASIRELAQKRAERINAEGGIGGRKIRLRFLDNHSDAALTGPNITDALADPTLIAMLGIWTSTDGAPHVEQIAASGVPMISEMSVDTLFARHPNIYTMTRSLRDEQEVLAAFVADGFKRIAFIGARGDLYSEAYHRTLIEQREGISIAATYWLQGRVADNTAAVDAALAGAKATGVDLLLLSVGSQEGAAVLERARSVAFEPSAFVVTGSLNGIASRRGGNEYNGIIYDIADAGVTNLQNERLQQMLRREDTASSSNRFSPFAASYGARYADLVGLIAHAARGSGQPEPAEIRRRILRTLSGLAEGRRVWRGTAKDWTFTPERAVADRALIVRKLPGEATFALAPIQYVRLGDSLQRAPVLYVHLDVTRIHRVDSNEKTFEADLFLTLHSQTNVPIESIEFTNAYRGTGSNQPLIQRREILADGGRQGTMPRRIYRISGRFTFEPDLRKYPFDEQVFSIAFQPTSMHTAFFLQPPPPDARSQPINVDGWRIMEHYVGTSDLIIRSIAAETGAERVIPFYNFNYTWVMKRQVVDYMLRVVVPLTFILIVAYLAIFIPRSQFDAIIAIQVTALLSAIALYLALNQPQADDATLSDQIFVVAYATISLMIALTISQANETLARSPRFQRLARCAQIYLVPLVWLAMFGLVIVTASSPGNLWEVVQAPFEARGP